MITSYSYLIFSSFWCEIHADIVERRQGVKSLRKNQSKADRLNVAKQLRDKKRADVIQAKRMAGYMPPRVVALLPLSEDVDVIGFWNEFRVACTHDANTNGNNAMETEMGTELRPVTMCAGPQKKVKVTVLPPPKNMSDPLEIVDLGKCADVLICLLPGHVHTVAIDSHGEQAIRILRSMGMPSTIAVTRTPETGGNILKEKSAAKKRATEALAQFLPVDHYRMMAADTDVDFRQIVRHITDSTPSVPVWRQQRPHVIPEKAEFVCSGTSEGTLILTGYIRHKALSASQILHIPGAGDFQIEKIEAAEEPVKSNKQQKQHDLISSEMMLGDAVLAISSPEEREPLVRENEVDPLDAEQTWPTEEELAEAETKGRKKRLPKGTSEYQAAWIVDDDFSDPDDDDDDESMDTIPEGAGAEEDRPWIHDSYTELDPEEFNKIDLDDKEVAMAREEDAARKAREADDVLYPDEFELHHGIAARRRLAKYRGLKSFRTSPWDPREDLPLDYARVFAFENFKRAQKRAHDLANKVNHGGAAGADVGTYARVHVCNVPQSYGRKIVERVDAASRGMAPLLSTWGLLQHEVKLSVLNFSLRKEAGVNDPIANKEELVFVTGVRTYPARPVYSTDEHGADKHKMERFLHEGRMTMATIYGPITYPPCPVLAFKRNPYDANQLSLVATGSLKSCNPDRVIVKKIVLTGFPMKTHRSKAIVRSMFFSPEDIRWFSPVELWTKHGRRGRIREPLGTHGLFKSIFDGPLSQQDTVCMSLYKRVFPKWPETSTFA